MWSHLSTRALGTVFACTVHVTTATVKLEKASIIMMFSFPSLLLSIFVKSKKSRSNGQLAINDPCFTFGSLYGPLAFLHLLHNLTQLVTSWHIMLQKIFLIQGPMYTQFSGGSALYGAVVAFGLYKLLVVPTGDTWTPELHKCDEVLPSWIPNDQIGRDTSWHSLIFLF